MSENLVTMQSMRHLQDVVVHGEMLFECHVEFTPRVCAMGEVPRPINLTLIYRAQEVLYFTTCVGHRGGYDLREPILLSELRLQEGTCCRDRSASRLELKSC